MTMYIFLIYLAGVVKPLFTILVSVVTFGIVGVTLIVLYCAEEERPYPFWVWKALVGLFSMLLVAGLIPSEKSIYIMVGAMATKDVTQAVSDSPVFQKSIKLLEKKIDESLAQETKEK